MTTAEAASALGLAPHTIQVQIKAGRLRAEKRGRDWWVTPADVERYRRERLGKRRQRPASASA